MAAIPNIADIPVRLRALVDDGIALLQISVSKDGYEILVRSVQPHPRLGISTHKMYYVDEFLDLTSQIQNKPALATPPTSPNKGEARGAGQNVSSYQDAKERALRLRLFQTRTEGGLINQLSPSSLTYADLERAEIDDTQARAYLVARKLGMPKLLGRIATNPGLTVNGMRDIHQWWEGASAEMRFTLLSDAKSRGKAPQGVSLEKLPFHFTVRLNSLHCPFRDLARGLDQKKIEDEEDYEETLETLRIF